MDNGEWTIDNCGIAFGNLFPSVGRADTIIVHCQFSIVNYNLLVVLVLRK